MKPDLQPTDPVNRIDFQRSEELAGQVLNAALVTNRAEQLLDIDLRNANGLTYSVKYQKAAYRTGNFSFEVLQATEDGTETVPGNFLNCRADRYALLWPLKPDVMGLLVIDPAKLKVLVASPKYRKTWLTAGAVESNRRRGNKYVQAQNVLVPVADVVAIVDGPACFNFRVV